MLDGKMSDKSKFLPCSSKSVQKFDMPTIVLNGSMSSATEQVKYFLINPAFRERENLTTPPHFPQKLFMHCETSWGPEKATESQKACNYNLKEKR